MGKGDKIMDIDFMVGIVVVIVIIGFIWHTLFNGGDIDE